MTIEWLDNDYSHARLIRRAESWRWWRRQYVTTEVKRHGDDWRDWRFVEGGDSVADHDTHLASRLQGERTRALILREAEAFRAKLKNPWTPVGELPPAKVVKR